MSMFAQIIKMRIKAGSGAELERAMGEIHNLEKPGSGLIRSPTMRDRENPNVYVTAVIFGSEAKAREREADPARQQAIGEIQQKLAALADGPPEFMNLDVVDDFIGS